MTGKKFGLAGTILALVLGSSMACAQDAEGAFLTDYSKLAPAKDNPFEEFYLSPNALERAARYTGGIMIDQPELFIHPDSKYKGMKPDEMKVIADSLREAVAAQLRPRYKLVDRPGADVLYLRLAVGDIMLQKKKRSILTYTPVGIVTHTVKNLASETTDRINLSNMKIEGEILDSVTGEQFVAATASRGSLSTREVRSTSWDELEALFTVVGKRLACRLDNAKLPQAQWSNCGTIGLAASATP